MRKKLLFLVAVFIMLISTTILGSAQSDSAVEIIEASAVSDSAKVETCTDSLTKSVAVDIVDTISKNQCSKREALVLEVSRYLRDVHAPQDVSAEHIVDCCLENDFNISFLLAQGTIETHMGKVGIGKSRNSMFGIYKTFASRNSSVTFYVHLVKNKYMKPGKAYEQLLNKYVTNGGSRYAGNPHYEKELRKKYTEVQKHYNIYSTQYLN